MVTPEPATNDPLDFPIVSVIMPIRNEDCAIERTLNAVLAQDYPAENLEILLADGMSTDSTRQIISQFIVNHSQFDITLLDNPQHIVPTALNATLRKARGEFIVRVDGHTAIAPDYVRQCVAVLKGSDADNVGGKMSAVGENLFGEAVAIATSSPFGIGGARFHYSDREEWVDTVYMGAWRREVFERIGLFDEEFVRNQDDEFNYRLRAKGGKILLSPRINSTYTVRGAPGKLWKQYYQYGYWKVRVLQKHPRQMRPRQFVPPIFIAALLAGSLLLIISPLLTIPYSLSLFPLFIILGSYLIVDLAASFWITFHKGWRHSILLPLAYAILHISYGLGFLVGLVRFIKRWSDKQGKVPS